MTRMPNRMGTIWYALYLGVIVLVIVGCGASTPAAQPSTPSQRGGQTMPPSGQTTLTPILAASELAVGQNRLPLGVVKNGTPLNDSQLTLRLRFFYLDGEEKTKVQHETDALYRGQGLPFGLWVAYTSFDKPGAWGLEISIPNGNTAPQVSRIRLDVVDKASTPMVGSAAIPSTNLTNSDVPDLKQLTSDIEPDPELYQLTITDALAAKKPFLLAFSTPGFCETAVCGPNIRVIKQMKNTFKEHMNFIHVEVYPFPFNESVQQGKVVQSMGDWSLQSEPWTFLVDAQGIIQAKYEGGITFAELEPALQQLVRGQPIQPLSTTP